LGGTLCKIGSPLLSFLLCSLCTPLQATVYNNLNALVADGKLIRLSQPGAPDRYDNTTRHDHLICTRCGALADFKFTDLTHDIEAALGARIQSYDLRIHYLCPACRKAQEAH